VQLAPHKFTVTQITRIEQSPLLRDFPHLHSCHIVSLLLPNACCSILVMPCRLDSAVPSTGHNALLHVLRFMFPVRCAAQVEAMPLSVCKQQSSVARIRVVLLSASRLSPVEGLGRGLVTLSIVWFENIARLSYHTDRLCWWCHCTFVSRYLASLLV
jgi:hypothetical protein